MMAKRQAAAKRFLAMADELRRLGRKKRRSQSKKFDVRLAAPRTLRAFELAGLDFNSPRDWQLLANLSVEAINLGKGGRPKEWSRRRLRALANFAAEVYRRAPSVLEKRVCQFLHDQWRLAGPEMGGAPPAQTLLRRLQEAKHLNGVQLRLAIAKRSGTRRIDKFAALFAAVGLKAKIDKEHLLLFNGDIHVETLSLLHDPIWETLGYKIDS
jgi:hypothetical protein